MLLAVQPFHQRDPKNRLLSIPSPRLVEVWSEGIQNQPNHTHQCLWDIQQHLHQVNHTIIKGKKEPSTKNWTQLVGEWTKNLYMDTSLLCWAETHENWGSGNSYFI